MSIGMAVAIAGYRRTREGSKGHGSRATRGLTRPSYRVFAQLEAEMAQQRTREGIAARQAEDGYHYGKPPLGFAKDDGHLIESDTYDQVCTVLELVAKGELSKRHAARRRRDPDPSRRRPVSTHDHSLADDPAVERYAEATSWTLRQLGTSVERPDWYEEAVAATHAEE